MEGPTESVGAIAQRVDNSAAGNVSVRGNYRLVEDSKRMNSDVSDITKEVERIANKLWRKSQELRQGEIDSAKSADEYVATMVGMLTEAYCYAGEMHRSCAMLGLGGELLSKIKADAFAEGDRMAQKKSIMEARELTTNEVGEA